MAGPLAGIGIAGSALSGLLGAQGAAQSGQAQSQMLQYQAGIARLNQQIAENNRIQALNVGQQQAQQQGMADRFTMGRIRAAQGASGIDVGGTTAKAVQEGQQTIATMNQSTIRNNAAKVAYGYETSAEVASAQGQMYDAAAANVRAAIPLNVASSLIGGATSVSSKWLQASQYGIFGGSSGGFASGASQLSTGNGSTWYNPDVVYGP